jgi:hypothetical protein
MTASTRQGRDLAGPRRAAKITIGVGVVLVLCTGRAEKLPDLTLLGAVGVAVVVCAVAYLATTAAAAGRASAVILFVGVALVLAAVAGLLVRWQLGGDYAARYGEKTTVALSADCTVYEKSYRRSRLRAADRTECPNSTWQADGRTRTGEAVVSWESYERGKVPKQIEAYAVGDRAYSVVPEKSRTALGLWGGVPLWALWAGLALVVTAPLLGRLRRAT